MRLLLIPAVCLVGTTIVVQGFSPVTVTTRTTLVDQSPEDVQAFLAAAGNWPKIVTTSMGVESNEDVSKPLPVGKTVDEIFGLPPIIPLSVQWTCTNNIPPGSSNSGKKSFPWKQAPLQSQSQSGPSPGRLEFFSSNGLDGVAKNCEMAFDVDKKKSAKSTGTQQQQQEGTEVLLKMQYEPVSILAVLAAPILTIDNAVALKFLLPAEMRTQPELDKFRNLMGGLYGVAGLAHLGDCVLGPSQLLTMAGAPVFEMLPLVGQTYAILWCLMGPLSFALSRFGAGYADIGLILYGLVEVGGAALIAANYDAVGGSSAIDDAFVNAILVQAVVAAAWFYSARKPQ